MMLIICALKSSHLIRNDFLKAYETVDAIVNADLTTAAFKSVRRQ